MSLKNENIRISITESTVLRKEQDMNSIARSLLQSADSIRMFNIL